MDKSALNSWLNAYEFKQVTRIKSELRRAANFGRRHAEDLSALREIIDARYQTRLQDHEGKLPSISQRDRDIVEKLQQMGVVITSLDELQLKSTAPFLRAAAALKRQLQQMEERLDESFILANPSQVMQYPEAFMWGLDKRLLGIAENYLGLPVAYHGMYFHRDFVNGKKIKSKLWHRDMEDYRSFKAVVYLNHVKDEAYGPLQYIPAHVSERISAARRYRYGYVQDVAMHMLFPQAQWMSCLGDIGTVILIDTARLFHRGKVPRTVDRFAAFFDYTSRYPKRRYYCKSSLPDEMLAFMAKRCSVPQAQCLRWRRQG